LYYESERGKDKKNNDFHQGSPSQEFNQVQQKTKAQKKL